MRPIAAIILNLCAAGVGACADAVVAPAVPEVAQRSAALAATAGGATQERGTGVFVGDATQYRGCLGEVVHIHNELPFRWHRVVTPSGNVMFSDPFIPNAGTGTTEGLTTGRVWMLDHVVSPEVINTNAGVEAFFVAVLHWTRDGGPNFTMHNTFHFVQNANGDVTVNSFESRCVLEGGGA